MTMHTPPTYPAVGLVVLLQGTMVRACVRACRRFRADVWYSAHQRRLDAVLTQTGGRELLQPESQALLQHLTAVPTQCEETHVQQS